MDSITSKKDIKSLLKKAESFCAAKKIDIVFTYDISNELLETISLRTKEAPTMCFADVYMLKERLKNGCFLLKKNEEVIGHIFSHKLMMYNYAIYERSSLWVHPTYKNNYLSLLLMNLLTSRFSKEFLISIAQVTKVHQNNELLGMKHILISDLSPEIIGNLEKIGKLRDEFKYRYYVNPYFELKIKQLNKILIKDI